MAIGDWKVTGENPGHCIFADECELSIHRSKLAFELIESHYIENCALDHTTKRTNYLDPVLILGDWLHSL